MDTQGVIQGIIDTVNSTSQISRLLEGWERIIALRLGTGQFVIQVADGWASLQNPISGKADITFELDDCTFEKIVTQKITPLLAKLQGLLQSTGNIFDILRFSSILTSAIKIRNLLPERPIQEREGT